MLRILIVEDNHKFRATLSSHLKSSGYEIKDVETGEEGVSFSRGNDFDLLLVDLVLPGMNGLEMMKAMLAQGRKFKSIMMSAYLTNGMREKAREYGVDEFLEKPFEIKELTEIISQLLNN